MKGVDYHAADWRHRSGWRECCPWVHAAELSRRSTESHHTCLGQELSLRFVNSTRLGGALMFGGVQLSSAVTPESLITCVLRINFSQEGIKFCAIEGRLDGRGHAGELRGHSIGLILWLRPPRVVGWRHHNHAIQVTGRILHT